MPRPSEVQYPYVRIPDFPDYAINSLEGDVWRVTPRIYDNSYGPLCVDGTLQRKDWSPMTIYHLERGAGQVTLMPPKGRRGVKRSILKILQELDNAA